MHWKADPAEDLKEKNKRPTQNTPKKNVGSWPPICQEIAFVMWYGIL